jgi:hypothetical protein
MQLSIVVPVYNSAECLPELARRVQHDLRGQFETYELILVNAAGMTDHVWTTNELLSYRVSPASNGMKFGK